LYILVSCCLVWILCHLSGIHKNICKYLSLFRFYLPDWRTWKSKNDQKILLYISEIYSKNLRQEIIYFKDPVHEITLQSKSMKHSYLKKADGVQKIKTLWSQLTMNCNIICLLVRYMVTVIGYGGHNSWQRKVKNMLL